MPNPLLLLPFLKAVAVKKVGAFGLYHASKSYGFPRVYRRLLEANRLYTPPERRSQVQKSLAQLFRAPSKAYTVVKHSHLYDLAKSSAANGIPNAPPFLMGILKVIAEKNTWIKILKELESFTPSKPAPSEAAGGRDAEIEALKLEIARLKEQGRHSTPPKK